MVVNSWDCRVLSPNGAASDISLADACFMLDDFEEFALAMGDDSDFLEVILACLILDDFEVALLIE